jgi:hypothetical protein
MGEFSNRYDGLASIQSILLIMMKITTILGSHRTKSSGIITPYTISLEKALQNETVRYILAADAKPKTENENLQPQVATKGMIYRVFRAQAD